MPAKNSIKRYLPDTYYHIYNRGVNKDLIFRDDEDYAVFLNMMKRYLSSEESLDYKKRPYPNYSENIELLAYCLMPNHFHLLIYQGSDNTYLEKLMRSVLTSYSSYFNKKYNRVGHLFQSHYKATDIDNDSYLLHISRYIHLNPQNWKNYDWSSIHYYAKVKQADWVKIDRISKLFNDSKEYIKFVSDYEGYKKELDVVKHILANG